MDEKAVHFVKHYLLIAGGVQLGLLGLLGIDVMSQLFHEAPFFTRVFYIAVGVAAIMNLVTHEQNCRLCNIASIKKGKK